MLRVAASLDLLCTCKPHYGIYSGIYRYAQQHNWHLFIDENPLQDLDRDPRRAPAYDGVIARATSLLFRQAQASHVPLVNVWHGSPVRDCVVGVFPNFAAAGQIRAEHLLELGLQNFAVLGGQDDEGHAMEMEAFQGLLRELGHDCLPFSLPGNARAGTTVSRSTQQTLDAWLETWKLPIGVFVSSELLARILIQLCDRRGWMVPKDVAIIAGTNELSLCDSPSPTLSSIELGYEQIGYQAAQRLYQMLETGPTGNLPAKMADHQWVLPIELVTRESTDFFSAHDESVARALEFISRNSHLRIGPGDVAKAVHTELRTLQRRFYKQMDRPIAEEIRRVRIERAKRELIESPSKLSDIARKVGFGNAMHMYEVFRRELKITPSEYRKQRRRAI